MTTAPPLLRGDDCSTPMTIPTTADAASSPPCLPQHEQTEECLLRMLEAEDSVVSHLRTAHASSKEPAAHLTVWRERVAQWAYTVVDHVQADRAAVYNVLLLLDSYLDAIAARNPSSSIAADGSGEGRGGEKIDAPTYQLLAMSCLYLVLRLRDSRALSVEQLVSMSRNDGSSSAGVVITPRRVARAMKSILTALSTSWRSLLAAPAPGEFVAAYVQQLQQAQRASFPAATATTTGTAGAHTKIDDLLSATRWSALLDDATYLAELSVCDTYLRRDRPSVVAYAALLNVLASEQQQTATAADGLRRDLQSLQVLTGHVPDAVPGDTVRGVVARLGYVRSQSFGAASTSTTAAGTCEADQEPAAVVVPQEMEGEVEVVPTTVTPTTTGTPTSGVKRRIVSYEDVSAVVDAALPAGSSGNGGQGGGMKRVRGHTGDLAELLQRSSDLASFSSASDSEEGDAATATTKANNKNKNTTKRARLVAAAAATYVAE